MLSAAEWLLTPPLRSSVGRACVYDPFDTATRAISGASCRGIIGGARSTRGMKHERGDRRQRARNGEESEGHMVEGGERGTGEGEG